MERKIVIPGEIIETGDFLPGEGTQKTDQGIKAMKFGLAEESGKLIKVIPLSGIYEPRRGNIIIGKVENIISNGWFIQVNSDENGFLPLTEVPRFVSKDNLEEIMDLGDMAVAKISTINRRGIDLTIRGRGLGKIEEGIIVEVNPYKVPRIIGKEGSMIKLIKDETGCNITVGQNGVIWIKGQDVKSELLAKKAILEVAKKSMIEGLTEEITKWFKENKK
ncbi:MAG: exosome complex RNA-binding protein Rrp4 [Nanoarchaeota archaeon]